MKKKIEILVPILVLMMIMCTGCGEHTYIVNRSYTAAGHLETVKVIDTDTNKSVEYSADEWVEEKCLTFKDDPALK